MKSVTWVILGATSIIAQEFAHLAAENGHPLILVGRNKDELDIIAADLKIRHQAQYEIILCDFSQTTETLNHQLNEKDEELALFIAHSDLTNNDALNPKVIDHLITVNVISITQIIHSFLQKTQPSHRLIFLSSVAACRGRAKNSLYGASKAAIEVYLQGLQQTRDANRHLMIARLGFIDTAQTYGMPGVFYASMPKHCARACWQAHYADKALIYHPSFWRFIMAIIKALPLFIYKRLNI